jgi:hypothetical protein
MAILIVYLISETKVRPPHPFQKTS